MQTCPPTCSSSSKRGTLGGRADAGSTSTERPALVADEAAPAGAAARRRDRTRATLAAAHEAPEPHVRVGALAVHAAVRPTDAVQGVGEQRKVARITARDGLDVLANALFGPAHPQNDYPGNRLSMRDNRAPATKEVRWPSRTRDLTRTSIWSVASTRSSTRPSSCRAGPSVTTSSGTHRPMSQTTGCVSAPKPSLPTCASGLPPSTTIALRSTS